MYAQPAADFALARGSSDDGVNTQSETIAKDTHEWTQAESQLGPESVSGLASESGVRQRHQNQSTNFT